MLSTIKTTALLARSTLMLPASGFVLLIEND